MMRIYIYLTLITLFCGSICHAQENVINTSFDADFAQLCQSLETNHPDLYKYQPAEIYMKKKDSVRHAIHNDMTIEEFYLTVAPFVASIGDGHTNIITPVTDRRIKFQQEGGKTFPLKVRLSGGKLFVDFPYLENTGIEAGDELLTINNVPVEEITSRTYNLLGTEKGNAIKDTQLSPYFTTLLWYMYRWGEHFTITARTPQGIKTFDISGVTMPQVRLAMEKHPIPPLKLYDFKIDEDGHSATLTIKSLFNAKEISAYCDSVFTLLKAQDVSQLIIDVRGNSGGTSYAIDSLMNYLAHDAYQIYARTELKISPDAKAHYAKKYPSFYEKIKDKTDGSLYVLPATIVPGNRNDKNVYHGNVTLLVDERTYSGASTLAAVIRKSNAGEVKGETGCPSIYTADYLFNALPHSKLQYYIAIKKFYE